MPGLSQTRIVRNNPPCAIGLSASILDGFPDHAAGQSGSRIALSYCPAHRHERLPEYAALAYSGNRDARSLYDDLMTLRKRNDEALSQFSVSNEPIEEPQDPGISLYDYLLR